MSNLNAIGLIGALLIGASFFLLHAIVVIRNGIAGILGGVIGGVPVPYEFRWRALWNFQLPVTMNSGVLALLFAFLFLRVGDNIKDAATVTLAQACAVAFFAFSAMFLTIGPLTLASHARALRKVEAD